MIVPFCYWDSSRHGNEYTFMAYKAYNANVEVYGLDFGNIVARNNFTYIAAVDLHYY